MKWITFHSENIAMVLKLYKYTNLSEKEFKINLKRVKKNLKKPMEFEQKIYSFIPGNKIENIYKCGTLQETS